MRNAEITTTARARQLRQSPSNAERLLWGASRGRRLAAYKFVRQAPIGPFFADFVEVDGATHSTDEQISYDRRREAFLRKLGYRVVRVGNMDIYENLAGVVETIFPVLTKAGEARRDRPAPSPSPRV
jgi:very-short-patch-repair endonuclease